MELQHSREYYANTKFNDNRYAYDRMMEIKDKLKRLRIASILSVISSVAIWGGIFIMTGPDISTREQVYVIGGFFTMVTGLVLMVISHILGGGWNVTVSAAERAREWCVMAIPLLGAVIGLFVVWWNIYIAFVHAPMFSVVSNYVHHKNEYKDLVTYLSYCDPV